MPTAAASVRTVASVIACATPTPAVEATASSVSPLVKYPKRPSSIGCVDRAEGSFRKGGGLERRRLSVPACHRRGLLGLCQSGEVGIRRCRVRRVRRPPRGRSQALVVEPIGRGRSVAITAHDPQRHQLVVDQGRLMHARGCKAGEAGMLALHHSLGLVAFAEPARALRQLEGLAHDGSAARAVTLGRRPVRCGSGPATPRGKREQSGRAAPSRSSSRPAGATPPVRPARPSRPRRSG